MMIHTAPEAPRAKNKAGGLPPRGGSLLMNLLPLNLHKTGEWRLMQTQFGYA